MSLLSVNTLRATAEPGALIVNCTTDLGADDYFYRPDDPYGLSPLIKSWLELHAGEYEIEAYVPPPPPTADELRAQMPSITARQLRLTLVRNGYGLSLIDSAIQSLPAGQERDEATIEWEYATRFNRRSPTLLTIAAALGISAEDIDTMWQQAVAA